ncbi:MAG: hypothetical protein PHO14_10255 [Kiritimatiellae bacterium]|jgi:hypothetical protein|nr:hypothetical protein [Kiritimatiellia bacterium]MDD4342594.1 hypothetical protein [Kiritimatiellia bacterium]MDY0148462.1 hypothetical protein [Kiritimatiellia bacterium]
MNSVHPASLCFPQRETNISTVWEADVRGALRLGMEIIELTRGNPANSAHHETTVVIRPDWAKRFLSTSLFEVPRS